MPFPTLKFGIAALAAALTLSTPIAAQDMEARYTLSLRGVNGGTIALRGRESGSNYSVSAAARASGLVGALVDYTFDGQSQGSIQGGKLVASRYAEQENDDGEVTSSVTTLRNGRPTGVTFTPARAPRPYDIDPRAQSGVVDTLTALYAVLRPVAPGAACNQSYDAFDGRKVARLSLGAPQAGGDGKITCRGEYRRLRGYAPDDMADPATPLTFTYAPVAGGKVQVSEVRSPTSLGDAVLRRR